MPPALAEAHPATESAYRGFACFLAKGTTTFIDPMLSVIEIISVL